MSLVGWPSVPDLVGLSVENALSLAAVLGVDVLAANADGPPIATRRGTVVAQQPAPDTQLGPGQAVTVWLDEPLDPPSPASAHVS